MSGGFSVGSWNLEHFRSANGRKGVEDALAFVLEQRPDVLALYEVEGGQVFDGLVLSMPDYTFHVTEGPQVQEVLLGVRQGLPAFFTQKTEFRSGVSLLRPGALLTVRVEQANYPLLFMQLRSGSDPRGLGLRYDLLTRALDFARVLDKTEPARGPANYIFLADLGLLGSQRSGYADILAEQEVRDLRRLVQRRRMRVLEKDEQHTWWDGRRHRHMDVDLVVARDHLRFKQFGDAEVSVRGWPKLASEAEKSKWVERYSDHAFLFFELQTD